MIFHSIMEENIFVIVYALSLQKKFLKHHMKDYFEINGKQRIIMPKKSKYIKFNNFEGKIKSPFMIYADFKSILVSEDTRSGKQNPSKS